MKHIWSIFILIIIYGCTPPIIGDEEENKSKGESEDKPDLSYKLNWEGEKEKFQIDEEGIRLNDKLKEAGTAYLTLKNYKIYNQHWLFKVKLHFNPSTNNYSRFYLSATNNNLVKNENGYFIQIGGKKDNVSLILEKDNKLTPLIEGKEILKGKNSSTLYVAIEVDEEGNWNLYTKLNSEEDYRCEGNIKNNQLKLSYCSGLLCVYTASRWNGISYHEIEISDGVKFADDKKKKNDKEEVEEKDAEDDNREPKPQTEEKGKAIKDSLFFNEIMYDNKSDGAEYIELYNSSSQPIALNNLFIGKLYDSGKYISKCYLNEGLKGNISIAPNGYICFTKEPDVIKRKHETECKEIIRLVNLPRLSNEGGNLVLMSNTVGLIDKTRFGNFLHNDKQKHMGCALEKSNQSVESKNKYWESSDDKTGGTPGRRNSNIKE